MLCLAKRKEKEKNSMFHVFVSERSEEAQIPVHLHDCPEVLAPAYLAHIILEIKKLN